MRRVVSQGWLHASWRPRFTASHLSWTTYPRLQHQAVVKVHGVFPSSHGYSASSPRLQFHRIPRRDSAQVVTPFVQVGTYPTRNFALRLIRTCPIRAGRTGMALPLMPLPCMSPCRWDCLMTLCRGSLAYSL